MWTGDFKLCQFYMMYYCTGRLCILNTIIFVSTDTGLSNHVEDMNDKSTTAYTQ